MKKVIVDSWSGQMCNQFVFVANVLADAKELPFELEIRNFKYKKFFKRYKDKYLVRNSPVVNRIHKEKITEYFVDDERSRIEDIESIPDVVKIKGWPYYSFDSIKKNDVYVRNFFRLKKKIENRCEKKIQRYRKCVDLLVAVHMRRTDYKYYNNGEYYYDDQVYLQYCLQLEELFKNIRIGFVLFSDERIQKGNFETIKSKIYVERNNPIEDCTIMSMCDYIIGPPSTFNGWASYYGRTPSYWIKKDNDEKLTIDSFKIWLLEKDAYGRAY